jgi:hypothetical protein
MNMEKIIDTGMENTDIDTGMDIGMDMDMDTVTDTGHRQRNGHGY